MPVQVLERAGGTSKIKHVHRFETMMEIINIAMLLKPYADHYAGFGLLMAVGILWGIPFVVMGHGVSTGSLLAIVTGLILFIVGLLAEQLSLIRKEITLLEVGRG